MDIGYMHYMHYYKLIDLVLTFF